VISRNIYIFSVLLIFFLLSCSSVDRSVESEIGIQNNEIKQGNIHLILNERNGGFSLYYLSDQETARYEPLLNNRFQGSSYASVLVDGRTHHMGSRHFPTRLESRNGNPAFVFESPTLTVTQVFSPVTTINHPVVNGIMITFIIQNTSSENQSVGLRMIIDTDLRERGNRNHFFTDSRNIRNETLLSGDGDERYWISRGNNVSLMGSIANPMDQSGITPDYVHFANWRMLSDSRWRLRHFNGRSFLGDSAVSYIFEPAILGSGNSLTYSIFLTSEDIEWYDIVSRPGVDTTRFPVMDWIFIDETQAVDRGIDLSTLVRLQQLLIQFINGEIDLSERDLIEIERTIDRYRDLLR
jgi:hypothetical protein